MTRANFLAIAALCATGCARPMTVESGKDYTAYRADKIRVYVSPAFPRALTGSSDSDISLFGILFRRRVLTGEMFWEAFREATGSDSPSSPSQQFHPRERSSVDEVLAHDPGALMKLLNYEDRSRQTEEKIRRYDLWVTFDGLETGWGSFIHFNLVVENEEADHATGTRDFMMAARLVKLSYAGEQI